jgi:predicted negative regulator of RcsB-dependent stress response
LNQAKQSLAAGNPALAQTDLARVATRYRGTPAGAQSAMLLAQIHYDQGKIADGLKVLEPYQSAGAAGPSLASILALIGDGHLSEGKAPEAASYYQRAAAATDLPGERSMYLAKAGRAFMAAGKNAEAREIWEKLATDPDAVLVRNEAEVRLGELMVEPAGKS